MIQKEKLTPMMLQYLKTKEDYTDCILFYRLGDFYEMFFDDALTASRELELTLTGKSCGLEERVPMCGVPFHSASTYVARLIEKGYRVAICEQVEDPKLAKGIVKRDVTRVITPGTVTDAELLDEHNNNYLAVIYMSEAFKNAPAGMAISDISTGEIYAAQLSGADGIVNELARYNPREIIVNSIANKVISAVSDTRLSAQAVEEDRYFAKASDSELILSQFKKDNLAELDLENKPLAQAAAAALLRYLEHTQKGKVEFINTLTVYEADEFMSLDFATRRNLEITETMRDKAKKGSLLWVLDKTKTSMGARMLKQWIEKPLINQIEINKRLDAVSELVNDMVLRDDMGTVLSGIYDISRIISRLSLKSATPRDMTSLYASLIKLPELEYTLSRLKSGLFVSMKKDFDIMADVAGLLEHSMAENPSASIKDGNVIRDGFNEQLDMLRLSQKDGKKWIASLEADEKEKTGIKNLRIRYNKVFGYYIEVTNSNIKDVPERYIRKQTLTNCERYITSELKEIENTVLGASEKILALEAALFDDIRKRVGEQVERLKRTAYIVSVCDVLYSLAETASKNNYCMPDINTNGVIDIKNGRHPVVEKMAREKMFVPNDTYLNTDSDRVMIITGPNMAGKSTYMRQVAVITLMAQIGSFVPAASARISIVDKIFTRVGASDDIASGQSTFMLEMTEVSNILRNATKNSLIILDEIGRGTSTFDGLSIAWAVVEYVHNKKRIGAKTLFATHYHELVQLEGKLEGVKNYNIAVKKRGDDITFLRKIIPGGTDDSYGIEVAALAGVPHEVILRAKKILHKIENGDVTSALPAKKEEPKSNQLGFENMAAMSIAEELKKIDVTTFTPIEAMNKLFELSNKAKESI